MKSILVLLVISLFVFANVEALPKKHLLRKVVLPSQEYEGPSDPLILTKYLSDPVTARKISEVHGIGTYPSFSGFFTVNQTCGSNTFFWFFPAQNGDVNAPIIMFLQGGPGASSMFGLFSENGPYTVSSDGQSVIPNPHTWNKEFAMLFVDNPVGAGWSFTQTVSGFVRNEQDVADDLYSFLEQFFTVFNNYQQNDLYICGESYAGHYVPAISHEVWKRNQMSPKVRINMKGICIGDGSIDPLIQFTGLSSLLFETGFADLNQVQKIKEYEDRFTRAVVSREFSKAFYIFDEMLNGDFYPYPTYFSNITGLNNYFNFLEPEYPANPYPTFLNLPSTRSAIHVGAGAYWDYNQTCEYHLINDWMTSVSNLLVPVMNNYKVLIYTGQLDLILGSAANERFLEQLTWQGTADYLSSEKKIWRVGNDMSKQPAGYVRSARNFRQVVVRKAGHLLPLDTPEEALDMITRFIKDKPY